MWKGEKSLGLAGRTFVNRKRRVTLVLSALTCLIRHSWLNGYGEWVLLRLASGRISYNRSMVYGGWQIQVHWVDLCTNPDGGMIYLKVSISNHGNRWFNSNMVWQVGSGESSNFGKMSG